MVVVVRATVVGTVGVTAGVAVLAFVLWYVM